MSGHVWMIRRFGLRRWWNYVRARRGGVMIDYAQALTANERAILEERMDSVPWSQR